MKFTTDLNFMNVQYENNNVWEKLNYSAAVLRSEYLCHNEMLLLLWFFKIFSVILWGSVSRISSIENAWLHAGFDWQKKKCLFGKNWPSEFSYTGKCNALVQSWLTVEETKKACLWRTINSTKLHFGYNSVTYTLPTLQKCISWLV